MDRRDGKVRGILTLVSLLLMGCTLHEPNSVFERWHQNYAQTATVCEGRAQYWAGRQTPQEVASRCIAASGLVSFHPKELPGLP